MRSYACALRLSVFGVVFALGVAGLVPTATAVHLSCGQNVGESVQLDADLDCSGGGNGLQVVASNITIDLNGHTITGMADDGVGITLNGGDQPVNKVTITNTSPTEARIHSFKAGIQLDLANKNKILGGVGGLVVADNSRVGIELNGSSKNRIEGVVASNNGAGSLSTVGESGIDVVAKDGVGSNKNKILGNTSTGNGDDGIDVEGNKNKILNNTLTNNDDDGLDVDGNKNKIVGNTATDNGDDGLEFERATKSLVKNNTFSSNLEDGIVIENDSKKNKVKNNLVQDNGNNGIHVLDGAVKNLLKGNVAGVHPDLGGDGNGGDGIDVDPDAGPKNKIVRNTANGNTDDGIDVERPTTIVSNNVANNNISDGIDAVDGTKGSGNTATGNGGVDCTPSLLC